ncbi:hypothetical protein B0T22DRAFT_297586 [Podospora appendiculata]|uniref:ML-like domain-containing protein n=1 Tax=Podospora appendiculata TaxID=314037 RepID=A0AAE0X217_9PEZI|nr:hypothetical protein B0T22DRAFT_297586 [Podospora appendiculata]
MLLRLARPLAFLLSLTTLILPAAGESILRSSSLAACQVNSGFTASLFDVVFTPSNGSVAINMIAFSSIQGYVIFDISILAYGYPIVKTTIDPCTSNLPGLCPMTSGNLNNPFNLPVGPSAIASIPGIAYSMPDLDAKVTVLVKLVDKDTRVVSKTVACLEADVTNGLTIDLIGIKWATAAVIFLALFISAIISGVGYSNAASHIAANTMSLFGYFQAQAMLGLCGVPLPPVVKAWTQDFQWSMGIIKVTFIQDILSWYQRSTGGTPSTIFDSLHTTSVQVEKMKRSLPMVTEHLGMYKRAHAMLPSTAVQEAAVGLTKRANLQTYYGSYIVYGIQRVAYRAGIESTNLFMTGLVFFYIVFVLAVILVTLFKLICEVAAKYRWIQRDTFSDFRLGWLTVLKGILFRVTLIGYAQMTVLCIWELTQNDSPAEMVLAIFFFFGMTAVLFFAAFKVYRIAKRSVRLHRNPAYILFSDPQALNKWGFLYVQFRASAYYFIVPILIYTLVKGLFIALAQAHGTVQAVALIVIEAAALITASVMRPWMDKSTNSFNIAICAINFINAIFLFVFTDVFGLPPLVIGVVGVVLWIANASFALILLLMLIITTAIVIFHNNPDTRYQFMNDDRTSFMKSNTQLGTASELDALAMTARGDGKMYQKPMLDLDDDDMGSSMRDSPPNSARHSAAHSMAHRDSLSPEMVQADGGQHLRNRPSGSSFRAPSPFNASTSNSNLSASRLSHNSANMVGYKNGGGAR